ncbi:MULTISPECIES: hypothetical protein [Thalassobacter]|uniref:hypothetical protein n=1 Tax=Thalassobacter TaxID=266808 RepID=UPI00126A691B|nr:MULTISPECIES: hypothetical protein [Thalassobacter]
MTSCDETILWLEGVLEAEAKVLTTGTLKDLPELEHAKNKAWNILQVTHEPGNASDLSRIQKMATHNAKLLLAARDGIALANNLRSALSNGPKPLATYGANGQKSTVLTSRRSQVNSRSF